MNLYGYVGNDPVNGSDPTGLVTCTGSHINHPEESFSGCWGQPGFMCLGSCDAVGGFFGMMNPIGALPPVAAVKDDGSCWGEQFCIWSFTSMEEAQARTEELEADGWALSDPIRVPAGHTLDINVFTDVFGIANHTIVMGFDPFSGGAIFMDARPASRGGSPGSSGSGAGVLTANPARGLDNFRLDGLQVVGVLDLSLSDFGSLANDYASRVNGMGLSYGIFYQNSNAFAYGFQRGLFPYVPPPPPGIWVPGAGF
jgi:hypothetical protein